MAATVTSTDVLTLTGLTVPELTVTLAAGQVEAYTGRILFGDGAETLSLPDDTWVRRAVCYQAAWMLAQVDVFERMDVNTLTHDEMTVQPRDSDSIMLAPMARVTLRQCSWVTNESLSGPAIPAAVDTPKRAGLYSRNLR